MTSEEFVDAIKRSLAMNGDADWSADVVRALVEEVERLWCRVDDLERACEFVRMKAAMHERAAVVAWLHREAIRNEDGAIPWDDSELRQAADAIERGEHRREVKP